MIDVMTTTAPLNPPDLPYPWEGEWVLHHYRLTGLVLLALDLYECNQQTRRRDHIQSFAGSTPAECLRRLATWCEVMDTRYTLAQ